MDGHTTTHLRRLSDSNSRDEAVALAQLLAGDADKPADPTVVFLIEQALETAYMTAGLRLACTGPRAARRS